MNPEEFIEKYGTRNAILKIELANQGYNVTRNFEFLANKLGYRWLPILGVWVNTNTKFETEEEEKFFKSNML